MIEVVPPLLEEQINKALLAVFTPDDLKARFAQYWKPSVVSKLGQPQVGKNKLARVFGELDGNDVYAAADVAVPPRSIDTPEPKFPRGIEQPRDRVEVLYVVINEAGFPAIVQVTKSIAIRYRSSIRSFRVAISSGIERQQTGCRRDPG